jgi:hemerythrin-like domain-containing protein
LAASGTLASFTNTGSRMARTTSLRRQHDDILKDIATFAALLKRAPGQAAGASLLEQLSALSGKIKVHLAMEDNVLYPELLAAANQQTRTTAAAFKKEMGGIGAALGAFRERWKTADDVSADLPEFAREAGAVMEQLKQRIQRENSGLYPLADEL